MIMFYDSWYSKFGYKLEEDLRIWIESCPRWFCESSLFGNIDKFVHGELEMQYEGYIGDWQDRLYDEWRDEQCT